MNKILSKFWDSARGKPVLPEARNAWAFLCYDLRPVWKDCLLAWAAAAIIAIAIIPLPFPNIVIIGLAAGLISAGSYRAGFYVALGKVKQQSDKEKSDEQSEMADYYKKKPKLFFSEPLMFRNRKKLFGVSKMPREEDFWDDGL